MDVIAHNNPITASLASCHLFKTVEWHTIQLLTKEANLDFYDRGQTIFQSGASDVGLFLVKSGQVKLSILSPNGSERVIDVVSAGGTFGESALFSSQLNKLSGSMLKKGELIEIPKNTVNSVVKSCPMLAMAMLNYMGGKIDRLVSELENCCLRSARQRVVDYLLMQVKEQQEQEDQIQEILLTASKGITASLLDITPETFSRELHHLMKLGLIEVERKSIRILDLAGMRHIGA